MMQRKSLKPLVPLSFAIVSLLSLGCNDKPSSVGIGLLSSQDLVRADTSTVVATGGTTVRKHINTGSSENLLVGKFGGYEAKTVLRFTGIPDTLKEATVDTARLVLKARYRFGASEFVSFTVHKMVQGWTQSGITWDSVTTTSYEVTSRGSFAQAVADTDSVTVSLDPNLVSGWFQVAGTDPIEGIILIATDASGAIVGFNSFQSTQSLKTPYLVVKYTKGGTQSSITFSTGEDAFVANIDNLASDPNLLYVQAGVAYRSMVKFDFPSIPAHAGIHQAALELTLKSLPAGVKSPSVDSLFSLYLATNDSAVNTSAVIGHRLDSSQYVYSFTITPYVQRWVNGQGNFGLQLRAWAETSALDLFTFYSVLADPSVRPRVNIIYSRQL